MHLTRKQLFKWIAFLVLGVTLIGGALAFYNSNQASIHNELVALDLLPKPEAFTELYFKDSAHLPTSATRGQVVSFTFVIHNLETADYQYTYEVFVNTNGTKNVIASGYAFVKDSQYYIKPEKFRFLNSQGRQEVVVELINKRQSIDFWLGGQ